MTEIPKTAARECGECRACCLVYHVDAIKDEKGVGKEKKAWTWCEHCAEHAGCAIHGALAARAPMCHEFACLWREGDVPEEFQPDQIGMVLDRLCDPDTGDTLLRVTEVWSGALEEPELVEFIQHLVLSGLPVYFVEFEKNPAIYLREGIGPTPMVLRMCAQGVPLFEMAAI